MRYVLDTHILLWRLVEPQQLPHAVKPLFKHGDHEFLIPTVALLEIQYLVEIGRIDIAIDEVLATIESLPDFQLVPYDELVMRHSLRLTATRDPFDRMILAHALATSTPLLTKDRWMQRMAPHLVIA